MVRVSSEAELMVGAASQRIVDAHRIAGVRNPELGEIVLPEGG